MKAFCLAMLEFEFVAMPQVELKAVALAKFEVEALLPKGDILLLKLESKPLWEPKAIPPTHTQLNTEMVTMGGYPIRPHPL